MRKVLALLLMLGSASAAFGFDGNDPRDHPTSGRSHHRGDRGGHDDSAFAHDNDAVVRWKTIVGNITVSNNDAVGGINPGTTPWSTLGGSASVDLATGHVSFDVDGLVLNGGNATGTPGPIDQVEGSLICDAGSTDQTIFTTAPVPLSAQGNADFSGTFGTIPGTCTNPLFLIRIGPDLPGANQRWIATGAVRSFGDSHDRN